MPAKAADLAGAIGIAHTVSVSDSSKARDAHSKAPRKAARDTPRASEATSRRLRKQIRDRPKGVDRAAKRPRRALRDTGRSADSASKRPSKAPRDSARGSDRSHKRPAKRVRESPRALELLSRTSRFTRIHSDSARASEAPRRSPAKRFSDTSRLQERAQRRVAKAPRDTPRAAEAASRATRKAARDQARGADATSRRPLKRIRDTGRSTDATMRRPSKMLRDLGRTSDRSHRSTRKSVRESPRALESVSRASRFIRRQIDSARALEAIRRAQTKARRDTLKAVESALRRSEFRRSILDIARALESLARPASHIRAPTDSARVRELISRAPLKRVGELTRALEVISKTARATVITRDLVVPTDIVRKIVMKKIEADTEPIGFLAAKRLKIILERIRALEKPLRTPSKRIVDSSRARELTRRASSKRAIDTARPSEIIRRSTLRALRDAPRGLERISKRIADIERDSALAVERHSKRATIPKRDIISSLDIIRRAPVKSPRDAIRPLEAFTRRVVASVTLRDLTSSLDRARRAIAKRIGDLGVTREELKIRAGFIRSMFETPRALDYISKRMLKSLTPPDSLRLLEVIRRGASKKHADVIRALDVLRKVSSSTMMLSDTGVGVDRVSKLVSIVREFETAPVGVPALVKGKAFIETVKASELASKHILKLQRVTTRTSDVMFRTLSKSLIDYAAGEYGIPEKRITLARADLTRVSERLAKTLAMLHMELLKTRESMFKDIAKQASETADIRESLKTRAQYIRSLADSHRSLDYISKRVVKPVTPPERLRALELAGRGVSKIPRDTVRALEVFAKVTRPILRLEDVISASDRVSKLVTIKREFELPPVGVFSFTRILNLKEEPRVSELASKHILKLQLETSRTSDIAFRTLSKRLTDYAVGEYGPPEKHVKIVRREIPRVSEHLAREILKLHSERMKSLDAAFRDIGKMALESIRARDEFLKPLERAIRDPIKLREIAAKTQFTLLGETVRRVVTLTGDLRKWTDIIESSDYNSKARAARKLVDLLKRVRMKLE